MADDDGGPSSAEAVEATFRRGVRTWREIHGMSQAELAAKMSERGFPFHQATVYNLEVGRRPTRLSEAVTLAEVLKVPLTHLLGPEAPERVARFELARAATRVKELERDADHLQGELQQAREERDVLAKRYNELLGLTPVSELVKDLDDEGDPVIIGGESDDDG